MPHTRTSPRRSPHAFVPFIVVVGPLLCALTLTALGYVMFRAQAVADATGRNPTSALSGPLEYTVILALAGALVSLLMAMLGLALYARARREAEARELALTESLERIAALDQVARQIAERGERREAAASAWARRQRDALAQLSAMARPRSALQRIANDIWAGISHPGAPLDAQIALRMARESAVAGAALGAALDDLRSLMASAPAEVNAIEAIDDALVEDLIALEKIVRQTRQALVFTVADRHAAPGSSHSKLEDEVIASSREPAPPGERSTLTAVERAAGERSGILRAADPPPPNQPFAGERPLAKDAGVAWPPPPEGDWPARSQGAGAPNMRPGPGGSSGQWPRRPGDASRLRGEDSNARLREPRDRDDSSSQWLND